MTNLGMKSFITEDFLLQSQFAKMLYHDYAKNLPIIDYHCHLPPEDIANNKQFDNLTKIWLEGDHYKWRALRTLGVDEQFITGTASDKGKFLQWAKALPYMVRNPLYHWSHLELQRYFGVDELLTPENANEIHDSCTGQLKNGANGTHNLITKMKVEAIGTTDDPIDDLHFHKQIAASSFKTKVLPTFRPDKALAIDTLDYKSYLRRMSAVAGVSITSYSTLLEALQRRIEYFSMHGCKLSDHGLEHAYFDQNLNPQKIFEKGLRGEVLEFREVNCFKYALLLELGKLYHANGWVQQFHIGALRNTNTRILKKLGTDAGVDSIGDFSQASSLASFLNKLDESNQLAKTIIYNLNPTDNEVFASMIGNFNDGAIKGKMQFGSAWWFLDQKDGMTKQINALSNLGMLSCFIGMTTDSRSFLSYPRHEYFRRLLCNIFAQDVEQGELPRDAAWLGKIVQDICYYNAKEYFSFTN